ncbi:MAG: DUF6036 family nucleotidyltransferase [Candidatus Baltobacteraceae bacterium]
MSKAQTGAYADPVVVDELLALPSGWRERLVKVADANLMTPKGQQGIAWCLHPNDIIVSKYIAGRDKDYEYCEILIGLNLPEVNQSTIEAGLDEIARMSPDKREAAQIAKASTARAFERRSR